MFDEQRLEQWTRLEDIENQRDEQRWPLRPIGELERLRPLDIPIHLNGVEATEVLGNEPSKAGTRNPRDG